MNSTERFKKVMDILENNNLCNCSRNHTFFEKLKDTELDDNNKINEVINSINEYKEREKNNTNKYPDYIMRTLRQRRGLDEYDNSKDSYISEMSPERAFSEMCEWNGFIGWSGTIKGWIKDTYGIELE